MPNEMLCQGQGHRLRRYVEEGGAQESVSRLGGRAGSWLTSRALAGWHATMRWLADAFLPLADVLPVWDVANPLNTRVLCIYRYLLARLVCKYLICKYSITSLGFHLIDIDDDDNPEFMMKY